MHPWDALQQRGNKERAHPQDALQQRGIKKERTPEMRNNKEETKRERNPGMRCNQKKIKNDGHKKKGDLTKGKVCAPSRCVATKKRYKISMPRKEKVSTPRGKRK